MGMIADTLRAKLAKIQASHAEIDRLTEEALQGVRKEIEATEALIAAETN